VESAGILENFACEIQNPGFWNPEYSEQRSQYLAPFAFVTDYFHAELFNGRSFNNSALNKKEGETKQQLRSRLLTRDLSCVT